MAGTSARAISCLFACPQCHRLDTDVVSLDGSRMLCSACRKSSAVMWAESDPPLRSLRSLLCALESHGDCLPDFKRAFDPLIQAIRKVLVALGYLESGHSLTSRDVSGLLPLVLCELGAASTADEAESLPISRVLDVLSVRVEEEYKRCDEPDRQRAKLCK